MNESIKDKFLKEHALNDDELGKVSGGNSDDLRSFDCKGWGICGNPSCNYYNRPVPVYGPNTRAPLYNCVYCNSSNVTDLDF